MLSTPLYAQIELELRKRLDQASPGELMPSEPSLATEFGVARMTVRAAINRLEAEGLIDRIPGRGTFARRGPTPRPSGHLMSFHDQIRHWGRTPSSRVVEARLRPATVTEQAALYAVSLPRGGVEPVVRANRGTSTEASVVAITRVRLADGIPLAVERACFAASLSELLDVDLERRSLHQTLRDLGRHPTLGSSTITAQMAGEDAAWLTVHESDPVLVETRLIVDQDAVPLEYTVSRYLGSRYSLQVAFDVHATAVFSTHCAAATTG